jgi:signal transduction histidine kinase
LVPNLIATLAFFAFALVSWLTARTLERALADLRAINRELDQRVEERTQELTKANEQLADANERLKELDRLKSRFLSMVSHDLRTPLNAILGFAEMLDAGVYGPLVEKQQGAVNRIVANVGRQMSLVNDLLDQARIEAGRLSLETTAFAPSDLIDGLVSEMGTLAQTKGLELSYHIVDNVPATLSGDPQRLHQILANLVGNAIKFTEQGSVHLRVFLPDKTRWALEVSDTGPGIPKEAGEYIFDAFRQVDSSDTRKHSGVGLGLSIVKQLTTLMGGEITLESEVGRGSTFTVVLPLVLVHE